MLILWIILFSTLGSIGAILTAAMFLKVKKDKQRELIPCLVAYATGTLLTAALLGMIPHALGSVEPVPIMFTVLAGILLFFMLEKFMIIRHCHDENCDVHSVAGPAVLLVGDAMHNLIDGVVIAASFLTDFSLGVIVSVSVIVHEIPQELGDFAILLNSGYSKKKAFKLNILSGISTIPGAIIAYYALDYIQNAIPYVMALSAASFLYLALSDLTPELHRSVGIKHSVRQFLLMLAGILTIVLVLYFHP